jgi:hypothetical protein
MAFRDHEFAEVSAVLNSYIEQHAPPREIRHKVDLQYRTRGQSIEIYLVRPSNFAPGETIEEAVAKLTYVRSDASRRILWMRSDLKWHLYEPRPVVQSLLEALAIVREDRHGCFWG